jgi:CRP-like cAMP-binding protein
MSGPKITVLEATREHEMFYSELMESALRHKLQDREIVALLSVIVGRMCAGAAAIGTEEDRATLVDTAIHNLHFGREHGAELINALGKGH